jgi:hypothetical protein
LWRLSAETARGIILTVKVKDRKKNIALDLGEREPELWAIFGRLENERATPQSDRVGRILELLSRLGEKPDRMAAVKITSELRHLLDRYRWITRALISPTTEGYRAIFRREPKEKNLSREDEWEYEAVRELLDITTRYPGALSRLRQCGNKECRRWLFTPWGKTRQFCKNDICKQRHFDSDPEQREKKREYMQKRYRDQAKHARNPKSGVGLRRKSSR